jgi:hypothetical protein
MILLDNTSSVLQIVSGGQAALHVQADWVDLLSSTVTPSVPPQNTLIAATPGTTTVVGSPAATYSRSVVGLSITNTSASLGCTVQVQHNDGTNVADVTPSATLPANSTLIYNGQSWDLVTSNFFRGAVVEVTDGLNGNVGVAPANTAGAVAQPALVTTLSPNSAPQPNTSLSGTLSSVTAGPAMSTAGMSSFSVVFEAVTAVATITMQESRDGGTTWQTVKLQLIPSGLPVSGVVTWSGATVILFYGIAVNSGVGLLRANMTSYTSGGPVVYTIEGSTVAPPFLANTVGAPGAAIPPSALQVGGNDGTDIRALSTDSSGRVNVVGPAAAGAVPVGNPVLAAGYDGTDVRTILTDTSGRVIGEITDGTNGIVGVAPASTAPVATQPALVVALSPNSQPYTDSSPATQNITAQDTNTTSTTVANGQTFFTGTPTAGSAATFTLASQETVTVQVTGTWTGTLQAESSMDGGTTYTVLPIQQGTYQSAWTQNFKGTGNVGGTTQFRIRATAAWTGTATVKVVTSSNPYVTTNVVTDTTNSASLAALNAAVQVATSGQNSVALEITNSTFTGTLIAEVSADGTTWNAAKTFSIVGTPFPNGVAYAASSGAGFLSILLLPGVGFARIRCSAYTSGSSLVSMRASTAGKDLVQLALGTIAAGALPTNALMAGLTDGTALRGMLGDTSGRPNVVGAAADGAAVAGNPVLVAGQFQTTAANTVNTLVTDQYGDLFVSPGLSEDMTGLNRQSPDVPSLSNTNVPNYEIARTKVAVGRFQQDQGDASFDYPLPAESRNERQRLELASLANQDHGILSIAFGGRTSSRFPSLTFGQRGFGDRGGR